MSPKQIVDAIENRLGLLGAPVQVRDALEREFLEVFSLSEAQAAEQSDRYIRRVIKEIDTRRSTKESAGEISILHLRGTHNEIVHGSLYIFANDSEFTRKNKLNRNCVNQVHDFLKSLSFSDFEILGSCILRELGCHTAKITPHASDQGIDFYGEFSVGGLLKADPATVKLMHDTKIVLVGQAKHYPTRLIGPSTIRELIGALSLSKTSTFSNENIDLLDGVHLKPFSPLLAMLFSTGGFTKGARTLCERAGIISFSGPQLSVFLSDRGIGITNVSDSATFDEAAFRAWLAA